MGGLGPRSGGKAEKRKEGDPCWILDSSRFPVLLILKIQSVFHVPSIIQDDASTCIVITQYRICYLLYLLSLVLVSSFDNDSHVVDGPVVLVYSTTLCGLRNNVGWRQASW
jgi:hypothetical protein